MSLADQLKAVALRKTTHRKTESKQNASEGRHLLFDDLKRERDQNARLRACDLEEWCVRTSHISHMYSDEAACCYHSLFLFPDYSSVNLCSLRSMNTRSRHVLLAKLQKRVDF